MHVILRKIKRFLIVFLGIILAGLVTYRIGNATLYNMTVQLVDSMGNIMGGTASAQMALFNETVRVVDATGHVLNFIGTNIASYIGPISITGNQTNGADQISHVNVNGTLVPQTYGASGSNQTITCTATATNNVLSCTGVADFAVGQGILIPHAGPAALTTSAPSAPTVTTVGTTGSTHYDYEVAIGDYWGGISAASASAGVTNGNASPSQVNYSHLVVSNSGCTNANSYCAEVIYQRIAGAGNYNFYGVIAYPGGGTWDASYPPNLSAGRWPTTAPASTLAQDLVTSITAINGNNITVTTAPSTNSTSVTCLHDDTAAMQSWVSAISTANVEGFVPNGTYNLNEQSYYNGTAFTYVNPTTYPTANKSAGYLHLTGSNIRMRGASEYGTILTSLGFGGYWQATVAVANPNTSFAGGQLCNFAGPGALTTYPINNVTSGSAEVVTTTAANAGNFNPGDRVWYGGGIVDGAVSCGLHSTPAAELNEVKWVNAATGQIGLRYAVTRAYPYGTPGTANFIAQVNAYSSANIQIKDMTINSGGSQTVLLWDTVRGRLTRLNLMTMPWDTQMLLSEGRDITIEDSEIHSAAWEEIDEAHSVKFLNDYMLFEGGGNGELAFTEGCTDVDVISSHIVMDDQYCGITPFVEDGCASTVSPALSLGGAMSHARIINNTIDGNWTLTGEFIQYIPGGAGDPNFDDILIEGNVFTGNSSSTIFGVGGQAPLSATRLVVQGNRCAITAGASPSWCIGGNTGIYANNVMDINSASVATTGAMRMNMGTGVTATEPLIITGNTITGTTTGNVGIWFQGSGTNTGGISVTNNIVNMATGIDNSVSTIQPSLGLNNNPSTTPYVGPFTPIGENLFGGTAATTASNAATNFMSLQAQTVNATETNVQMVAPRAGVIGQLRCHLGTTPGAATGWTFTLRDNAASPSNGPTCTATAAATCSDTTHSAIVAAGDLLDVQIVPNSTPTASTVQCSIQFGT